MLFVAEKQPTSIAFERSEPICAHTIKTDSKYAMTEPSNTTSFENIVQWAYGTMPEKIRNLPDFPGIQVADEPPVEMFERMSKRSDWPPGTELLGCYSGVSRAKRQHNLVRLLPS